MQLAFLHEFLPMHREILARYTRACDEEAEAKSFAMLAAAILAITLNPALRLLFVQRHDTSDSESGLLRRCWNWLLGGPIRLQEDHPIMGPMMRAYDPTMEVLMLDSEAARRATSRTLR